MTIEQLQSANKLIAEINHVQSQLDQVINMLDTTNENSVRTRVKGMDFTLPKSVFTGELTKLKKDLETELSELQNQFDAV